MKVRRGRLQQEQSQRPNLLTGGDDFGITCCPARLANGVFFAASARSRAIRAACRPAPAPAC